MASSRFAPHISSVGRRLAQKAGRSGFPNSAQRRSGNNCTHRTPAGLPRGMPGIGDVIEGAIQHAPQFGRHSMSVSATKETQGTKQFRRQPAIKPCAGPIRWLAVTT